MYLCISNAAVTQGSVTTLPIVESKGGGVNESVIAGVVMIMIIGEGVRARRGEGWEDAIRA